MKELNEVLRDWEAVIGLEIHTELTTLETKMFCGCKLSHDDEPNTNVCPVCLGLPGALPVPNKRAIEYIVKAGLATNCEIQKHSMFYRKHYFYPDMAKNFQTTQGPVAFAMHGRLDLEVTGRGAAERPECAFGAAEAESLASASAGAVGLSASMARDLPEQGGALAGLSGYDTASLAVPERREDGSYTVPIRILRIHMEEDAAKMVHVGGEEGRIGGAAESLIDYNRCGTPLIELVTEPDLRTPEEARLFMEKLRRIFLALGISDCSMEKGSMRCDGNVSLRRRGDARLGTKTELKNLNSFKALHDGLAYEICRQAEVLEAGGEIYQETRHWEPSRKRTVAMRVKETADDYRFFPDPDLAPFDLTDEFIEHCRAELPELPDERRDRYVRELGIKRADAEQIAGDPEVAAFFEEAVGGLAGKEAQTVANLVVNELPAYLRGAGLVLAESVLRPEQVAGLAKLLASDAISSNQGHEVFEAMAASGDDPERIVDARGMRQVSDAGALQPIVDEVLERCAEQAQQYRDGNQKVLGFLVGQCMKASRSSGNPKRFNELLRAALEA
ncbi:Asp-tRNA(Asn)/Glu-tRNA(Gln) amidotransferase subunit GatB [[Collinsella] massiliensis]|uniref:Aspartyl/glutamyl-tRNA(Asn/Gln) amidotransferase subunit B n=1 Tax=[Collinsella] massiliensis TaxID=1232426 RepID=A0A1Y3XXH3_9ACTN|nr:Asp-tRNA(Asn)/Glu-tRNA(Gln) amidotransferase subunit GatB [[Collinsella] massiliensis]OUN89821.1 glutaminyl-tRNA synthase (glutamine-hydrolyzing) subunit B [[Collinsella] massiliensis]